MVRIGLSAFFCCLAAATGGNPYPTIGAIPLPAGYHRVAEPTDSFGAWLRNIALKKELTVYLYNGMPKPNQDAQFAVLNVSVSREDLQQCADAVMRLRAEYLFHLHDYAAIDFYTERGARLNFARWAAERKVPLGPGAQYDRRRRCFDMFLREVFGFCSTRTLARQLVPAVYHSVNPGDVLIRSGSPGHAMLVVDAAADDRGHRIYLLAQSYMPAQDIHIVRNPTDGLTPWYRADSMTKIVVTPEYTFRTNELRTWTK